MTARSGLIGVLSLVLLGCSEPATDELQARQEGGIHQVAQQAAELPGVVCARGALNTEGLPSAPLGSLAVYLTPDPALDRAGRLALFEQVGRVVWESDLVVSRLVVAEPSGLELGESIGSDAGTPTADELERAFGPRPPAPSPLPPLDDPGNPTC